MAPASVTTRFLHLRSLEKDWDSYGSKPIDREAIKYGANILRALRDIGSQPPSVVPINSGGIQMEWHIPGWDIEIQVNPGEEDAEIWVSKR